MMVQMTAALSLDVAEAALHDMIGVALLIVFICFCFCLLLVAMSWLCETVLQHMLSSFLNLNALPVPLLRQVSCLASSWSVL